MREEWKWRQVWKVCVGRVDVGRREWWEGEGKISGNEGGFDPVVEGGNSAEQSYRCWRCGTASRTTTALKMHGAIPCHTPGCRLYLQSSSATM